MLSRLVLGGSGRTIPLCKSLLCTDTKAMLSPCLGALCVPFPCTFKRRSRRAWEVLHVLVICWWHPMFTARPLLRQEQSLCAFRQAVVCCVCVV